MNPHNWNQSYSGQCYFIIIFIHLGLLGGLRVNVTTVDNRLGRIIIEENASEIGNHGGDTPNELTLFQII